MPAKGGAGGGTQELVWFGFFVFLISRTDDQQGDPSPPVPDLSLGCAHKQDRWSCPCWSSSAGKAPPDTSSLICACTRKLELHPWLFARCHSLQRLASCTLSASVCLQPSDAHFPVARAQVEGHAGNPCAASTMRVHGFESTMCLGREGSPPAFGQITNPDDLWNYSCQEPYVHAASAASAASAAMGTFVHEAARASAPVRISPSRVVQSVRTPAAAVSRRPSAKPAPSAGASGNTINRMLGITW